MKKLGRKGTVHPSSASTIISDHLSMLLPAAILTLTAALSSQDKEVLAYLVSSSNKPQKYSSTTHEHPSSFKCDCFRCYMSYWIRWDTSPNRQLIHEIIDAYELDAAASLGMLQPKKNKKDHGRRRKRQLASFAHDKPVQEISCSSRGCGEEVPAAAAGGGSLRRFMTFFGERIRGTLRPF
ncbi:hypothetical protein M5689_002381 [Euphorbia peplus]|nr:hypothetical protein M5689_002381 [Euphorbia peplus]